MSYGPQFIDVRKSGLNPDAIALIKEMMQDMERDAPEGTAFPVAADLQSVADGLVCACTILHILAELNGGKASELMDLVLGYVKGQAKS